MTTLPTGERFSNTMRVLPESKEVETSFTLKQSKDDLRTVINWTFDFSACTEDELLVLAARQFKVDAAANWRAIKTDTEREEASDAIYDVAEHVRASRKSADPLSKLEKLLGQLSPTDREAFLKRNELAD